MTDPCASPAPTAPSSAPSVAVPLVRLDPDLPLPSYAQADDAGADLVSRVEVTLPPGARALVPTGVALAIPAGHAGFVHPRSGLAARHGISIVNAPGTVDAGYRGEILVNLINLDRSTAFTVHRGDRIAQLVVQRVERAEFTVVDSLDQTARGDTGHGSTGGFGPPRTPRGTPPEASAGPASGGPRGTESSNQRTE
ncbi:MAG: dUTP diphosphatase [Dermatophilaceae bacterium]